MSRMESLQSSGITHSLAPDLLVGEFEEQDTIAILLHKQAEVGVLLLQVLILVGHDTLVHHGFEALVHVGAQRNVALTTLLGFDLV